MTFYVSPDSTEIQDVQSSVNIACSPSFSFGGGLVQIPSIAIAADGSFDGSSTQSGVFDNVPATFTYTFVGHFHGTDSGGSERVAGQLREDVSFANGTAYSCTSNLQSWSAARQAQGSSQSASSPPAGSYSGSNAQGGGVTFYVSPDSTEIQDVQSSVNIACSPSFSFGGGLVQIPSIAIAADGSFDGSSTQSGVFDNVPATFTYTFVGHFHGTNSSGSERVAGQLREDVSFANGTAYSCTSNLQSWSAARQAQGSSQSASSPPAGSYSGSNAQGGGVTFSVSPDSTQIQNVQSSVNITCSPSFSFGGGEVLIPSIAIAADGSFSGSSTGAGTIDSVPATFTYTFVGHFHGTNSSGSERVAGQLREDVTFTNGTSFSCTSNLQSWSATGP